MRVLLLSALIACALVLPAAEGGDDPALALAPAALLDPARWTLDYADGGAISLDSEAAGGAGALVVTGKAGKEKRPWAALSCALPQPVALPSLAGIALRLRAPRPVQVKLALRCAGGVLRTDFQAAASSDWQRLVVPRSAFKAAEGRPDLGQVQGIQIGLGLWNLDTTQGGFRLEVARPEVQAVELDYLLPRPKRTVAVDGAFRDWGDEDVLYNWTPPAWITLGLPGQGVGAWPGRERLSGRVALMMDDERLYLLARVVDAKPFQGRDPAAPWNNDALELFLALGANPGDLRFDRPAPHTAQLVVDCGDSRRGSALLLVDGKPVADAGVQVAVVADSAVEDGRRTDGYVLEAAIPLKALGLTRSLCQFLGYSLKLDDADGFALLLTPWNPRPHASMRGFRSAWVEVAGGAAAPLAFAAPAAEPWWRAEFCPGGERVAAWDPAYAWRERPDAAHERLYLNGLWAWQEGDSDTVAPAADGWAYIPLPMGLGWYAPVFERAAVGADGRCTLKDSHPFPVDKKKSFHWYERTVELRPAAGERWYLVCDYLDQEATVFVNGRRAGRWDGITRGLDVTALLVAGRNRIDLAAFFPVYPGPTAGNGVGITGDVWLERRARAPLITDVWFRQAAHDGAFRVAVEAESAPGRMVELALLDDAGRELARAAAPAAGSATELAGRWQGVRPWSPEQPSLVTWQVTLRDGGALVDQRRGRTGFRSFAWDGGRLHLNGVPLRLRNHEFPANPSGVVEPGRLEQLKRFGCNGVFIHSASGGNWTPFLEQMDRVGLLCFAPVERELSPARAAAEMRRYRNHPSVVGWITDPFGTLDVNGWMRNPFKPEDAYLPDGQDAKRILATLFQRRDFFRSLDPTRPYISHAAGTFPGGIRTDNRYPSSDMNLIDRMAWYRPWAQRSERSQAFHIYESGASGLMGTDYTHPEQTMPVEADRRQVQRLVAREHLARYAGEAAFGGGADDGWRATDALVVRAHVRGLRFHGLDGFTPWVEDDVFLDPFNCPRPQAIEDRRKRSWLWFHLPVTESFANTWLRMDPWYYRLRAQARWSWGADYGHDPAAVGRPNPYTGIWLHEMQPVFAGLFGPPREPQARERTGWAGETIERVLFAVNDGEHACDLDLRLTLDLAGKLVEQRVALRLAAGEDARRTLSFTLPTVAERTAGTLRLSFRDPQGRERGEEWPVVVFPRPAARPWTQAGWQATVAVLPAVEAPSLLAAAGLPAQRVRPGDDLAAFSTVVVESGALAAGSDHRALLAAAERGARVLILEQRGDSALGWRLRQRRLEAVFPADRAHPALAGLGDGDLAFLRGPAASLPATHEPSRHWRNVFSMAMDTPHLSSDGVTAGWVLETPAYGAIHPILVGGYDLGESALIEVRHGRGSLVLCQVDLSGRYGSDPAATRLADNLLAWAASAPAAPAPRPVRYLGGARGRALLDRLGVAQAEAASPGGVLVLGEDASPAAADLAGAAWVVPLPGCAWLPPGCTAAAVRPQGIDHPGYWNKNYYQFIFLTSAQVAGERLAGPVPAPFTGLVVTDTCYSEGPELRALAGATAWSSSHAVLATAALPGGAQVAWCGIDPLALAQDDGRAKALRVWSVLFANLGAASRLAPGFGASPLDLSEGPWSLVLDPAGDGEKSGIPRGELAGRTARPIRIGRAWEEQGVTDANPTLQVDGDCAYDGFAWYVRRFTLPAQPGDGRALHLHCDGVLDTYSYAMRTNTTDLFINGVKQAAPAGIWAAQQGGRGGRLWKLDPAALRWGGAENLIAIRVYNRQGPGGLHRAPVRLEWSGRNHDSLLPYEFQGSKLQNYYFWSW